MSRKNRIGKVNGKPEPKIRKLSKIDTVRVKLAHANSVIAQKNVMLVEGNASLARRAGEIAALKHDNARQADKIKELELQVTELSRKVLTAESDALREESNLSDLNLPVGEIDFKTDDEGCFFFEESAAE